MNKYEPLWRYLKENDLNAYQLSFEKIKSILGFELNHSFLLIRKN